MDEALWALGRGTGIVGLVLFTASVVLGVTVRAGRAALGLPRFGIARLHRDVALLATAFIAVHMVSLLFDSYAQLAVVDLVVPFLSAYRPFWLGLGTLAIDVVLAVVITALLRHRVGPRVFRVVHLGAYALWPIALLHAVGAGSDAAEPWFLGLAAACTAAVAAAAVWRLTARLRAAGNDARAVATPVVHRREVVR